jgi:1-acyl-sn-glycerol-3-phosphate acyltransferase
MKRFFCILFSIYYWTWFTLVTLVFSVVAFLGWLFTFWWDPQRRLNNRISCLWSNGYLLGCPFWKVSFHGREKIQRGVPTLFISNHLSTFDIFVLFMLNRDFHWVSKRSNVRIPLIGLDMIYSRTIFLDRDDPREILRMVKDSVKRLEEGISLMIFPEGERSLTGHLQPFLGGAFSIAKRAKVQIQPIVLTDTYKIIKRYSMIFNPRANVTVTILDPIPKEVVEAKSTDELKEMAYQMMTAKLPAKHQPEE